MSPRDATAAAPAGAGEHTDPAVIATTATNVLHAVNTIAAGLGLDNQDDDATGEQTAA